MNRREFRIRFLRGVIQPELFYIPVKGKHESPERDVIIIRLVNATKGEYAKISGLTISARTGNTYPYDCIVTSDNPYGQTLWTPYFSNTGHGSYNYSYYNHIQELLALPEDNEERIYYDYRYGMWGFNNDRWITYPWNYKADLVKADDWIFCSKDFYNPVYSPTSYNYIVNNNTPYVQGCTYENLREDLVTLNFPSTDRVVLQNLKRGQYSLTVYIDVNDPDCWLIDRQTSRFYYPNADYWRNKYVDMNFYRNWIEPYSTSYSSENEYYYADREPGYTPSDMYNRPYNTDTTSGAPMHYPYYWQDEQGYYETDINETHGNAPSYFTAPYNTDISVAENGKISFYDTNTSVTWIDPRYIDVTQGKITTPTYNFFYGHSRKINDNTLYYRAEEPTFNCKLHIYQEYVTYDAYDVAIKDYAEPTDVRYNWLTWGDTDFDHHVNYNSVNYYTAGNIYEITHDDGTIDTFAPIASSSTSIVSPFTIPLKKGRNIIRSVSAPNYSQLLLKSGQNYGVDLSQSNFKFQNDTHIEEINITREDLERVRNGTYTAPEIYFRFALPEIGVRVILTRKNLPPHVSVADGSYNYCNALEFYYNNTYCGYIQAGIAPSTLALKHYYGYQTGWRNGGEWYGAILQYSGAGVTPLYRITNDPALTQYGETTMHNEYVNDKAPDKWCRDANNEYDIAYFDLSIGNRATLTVQYQLGNLAKDSDFGYTNHANHMVNYLDSGDITLFYTLQGSTTYDHVNHCTLLTRQQQNWGKVMGNYITDCNCLNESNGIANNSMCQQYYYLGDGLTKETALTFLGAMVLRSTSIEFIDNT